MNDLSLLAKKQTVVTNRARAQGRFNMFDFNSDLSATADTAYVAKEVRKGQYGFRIDEITEGKSQTGAAKYEVKCTIIAQKDGQTDLIGVSRKQHFVTGHAKANVAKSYEAQFLSLLKSCGVDLTTIKDMGSLYMAIKGVEARKPVLVYDVEPQDKDPKYLNWVLVKGVAPVAAPAEPKPVAAPVAAPVSVSAVPTDDELFA